ncbi:MAG: ABC transporter permease [Clostridia bacterium]|nr:ABC transporter permease [Clostridia bacterium]
MQVFKAYLKILWRIKAQLLIYVGVFLALAFAFSAGGGSERATAFVGTKTATAWLEEGATTVLSAGLKDALEPYADFRDVPQDPEGQRDALFYRRVEVILRVPNGFEEDFMRGEDVKLGRTTVPDSIGGYAIDARVDKYLNTARIYRDHMPELDASEVAARTLEDLQIEADVSFFEGHVVDIRVAYCNSFFNYMSYTMLIVMILGVSTAMIAFDTKEIRLRNAASPLAPTAVSRQLYGGSLVLAMIVGAAMLLLAIGIYGDIVTGPQGGLLGLNVTVFSLVALSLSFLTSNFIRNRNVANGVANVISLGTSFISGAFVPQAMLGPSVLFAASFTPSYWFIKANNDIFSLTRFDWSGASRVFASIGIEVTFAVAFFVVSQVYVKYKMG